MTGNAVDIDSNDALPEVKTWISEYSSITYCVDFKINSLSCLGLFRLLMILL